MDNQRPECQGCIKLQAELAVMRLDLLNIQEKNRLLMELIQEVNRAVKTGKIEVGNG